jgi:hypothetical protein
MIVFFALLVLAPLFAAEAGSEKGFFYGAVGTGGVFYGSQAVTDRNTKLSNDHYSHIVLALSGGAALILAQPIYFTLGVDSILDFHTGGTKYAHSFDFSVNTGIRVYPKLAGFAFGIEYCLGSRTDIILLEENNDGRFTTPWGNGFRFAAEYDFTYQTRALAPIVGAAWKHMPRGDGNNDDYLSVYFKLGFRK